MSLIQQINMSPVPPSVAVLITEQLRVYFKFEIQSLSLKHLTRFRKRNTFNLRKISFFNS